MEEGYEPLERKTVVSAGVRCLGSFLRIELAFTRSPTSRSSRVDFLPTATSTKSEGSLSRISIRDKAKSSSRFTALEEKDRRKAMARRKLGGYGQEACRSDQGGSGFGGQRRELKARCHLRINARARKERDFEVGGRFGSWDIGIAEYGRECWVAFTRASRDRGELGMLRRQRRRDQSSGVQDIRVGSSTAVQRMIEITQKEWRRGGEVAFA